MMQLLPQPNYDHYLLDSQDYWARMRGQPEPPAPTYRWINGRAVLGRYVDPFGAQGLLEESKNVWTKWYTTFLISAIVGPLICGVDAVFVFLVLPIFAVWYLIKRNKQRALYDEYYAIAQEIQRTGQPQWVPFNKDRLALIERRPEAVWP